MKYTYTTAEWDVTTSILDNLISLYSLIPIDNNKNCHGILMTEIERLQALRKVILDNTTAAIKGEEFIIEKNKNDEVLKNKEEGLHSYINYVYRKGYIK